jgi:hypothetical protein
MTALVIIIFNFGGDASGATIFNTEEMELVLF